MTQENSIMQLRIFVINISRGEADRVECVFAKLLVGEVRMDCYFYSGSLGQQVQIFSVGISHLENLFLV